MCGSTTFVPLANSAVALGALPRSTVVLQMVHPGHCPGEAPQRTVNSPRAFTSARESRFVVRVTPVRTRTSLVLLVDVPWPSSMPGQHRRPRRRQHLMVSWRWRHVAPPLRVMVLPAPSMCMQRPSSHDLRLERCPAASAPTGAALAARTAAASSAPTGPAAWAASAGQASRSCDRGRDASVLRAPEPTHHHVGVGPASCGPRVPSRLASRARARENRRPTWRARGGRAPGRRDC